MISYRMAEVSDCDKIAALHAKNWKESYRGVFDDHYLDNVVDEERLAVWKKRFATIDEKQHIYVAYEGDTLVGFVCTFSEYHPEYGAYLDNLHVKAGYQGYGIGRRLISESAKYALSKIPDTSLYLYVLVSNVPAIKSYEKWKGVKAGIEVVDHQGATESLRAAKFVWEDPQTLLL